MKIFLGISFLIAVAMEQLDRLVVEHAPPLPRPDRVREGYVSERGL